MFSLSRIQFSKFAAMGSLVVLCTLGTPAPADELAQNLGPVGPHEPILTEVGSQRVIAFMNRTTVAALSMRWSLTKRTPTPA